MHDHRNCHRPATARGSAGTRKGALLLVLLVAQLMVILDITAVNIALPSLAADLELTGSAISWTITSYSLVFGSLLLLGGRAADLLGRRRMFLTGLGLFTLSSLATATAGSAEALFAARAGQGLGAAMLSPAALAIIMGAFEGAARARALAAWSAVGGAGAAVGVLVGGVLTEVADWRSIFAVNLPVAAALAVGARVVVPADASTPRWRGLDARGAVLATASLASIVVAITQAEAAGWASARTLVAGLGGVAGLAAFAALERRTAAPLLRIERLADRAAGGGLVLMIAAAGSIFGLFLLSSLYLQNALGMGPLATGLAFVPLALAVGAGAHVAGHVVGRHGVRGPLAAAFLVAAAGMTLLAHVAEDGDYVRDVLPGMLVAGAGLGVAVVAVSIAILTGARDGEAGMMSGITTTGHEIGGTIGIAALSAVAAAGGAVAGPGTAAGIALAFVAAAIIAIVAGVVALFVLPPARHFVPRLQAPGAMPVH
ncbi:MFS transporter [Miltoncostaea marina]|uniref:MFS transporter n=1 Tax=Miltoncostaea marina TaxID=2843215 RepID=UPI001C3D87FD|nr:MFS transporter [Miltoncostaea marina]